MLGSVLCCCFHPQPLPFHLRAICLSDQVDITLGVITHLSRHYSIVAGRLKMSTLRKSLEEGYEKPPMGQLSQGCWPVYQYCDSEVGTLGEPAPAPSANLQTKLLEAICDNILCSSSVHLQVTAQIIPNRTYLTYEGTPVHVLMSWIAINAIPGLDFATAAYSIGQSVAQVLKNPSCAKDMGDSEWVEVDPSEAEIDV